MPKKQRSQSGYDYSRIGYARRAAISALDDYQCSTAEIIAMFGCSSATFHRYDQDVRLSRRPARPSRRHEMRPEDAREIAIIALIRAGYKPAEIAEAIDVSPATVYRERELFEARLGAVSPAQQRNIHRYLKDHIIDSRAFYERKLDARRKRKRWRRGSRSKSSS